MRKTHASIKVMDAFIQDPVEKHWGYEISRRTGVRSGALYPILRRMLEAGWLEDGWEEQSEIDRKRPPRRYYKVTAEGENSMRSVLAEAGRDLRFTAPLGELG
jgi:PadR family transcriptional regulator PadR